MFAEGMSEKIKNFWKRDGMVGKDLTLYVDNLGLIPQHFILTLITVESDSCAQIQE